MPYRSCLLAIATSFVSSALFCGCEETGAGGSDKPDPKDDIPVVTGPDVRPPESQPGNEVDHPTSPASPSGDTLPWPEADHLAGVEVLPNRDSAVLLLPPVEGVQDYRAFVLTNEVSLELPDGRERVMGTTVYCAGFRQHNHTWSGVRELVQAVEVAGLPERSVIVVEALDRPCPFAGVMGSAHRTIVTDNSELHDDEDHDFYIFSEEEIRATYGSLLMNGHGPGPILGLPADDDPPVVLARTALQVDLSRATRPPVATFFDGFEDAQPFTFLSAADGRGRSQQGKIFQNDRWSLYSYGAEHTDVFFDRGRMHTVVADWAQDIFAQNLMTPRELGHLDDKDYLHVTFEVAGNATGRRYWWFFMCGADQPGQTFDENDLLTDSLINTPFFYQDDGRNPSLALWNCFHLFPRDGFPIDLEPDMTRPETDVRVMVNVGGAPERDNVVNVSPDQYETSWIPHGWFRTRDAEGNLIKPILDDQQLIAPNARYDIFLRRDRVVFYVNGDLRLCNDFGAVPLTMAEGVVGFGQVLYHSAAEQHEFLASHNDRSGQIYYRTNTPFLDARAWDNVGFEEYTTLPDDFDPALCHVYQPE